MKSQDGKLRFGFLTGVTKLGKLSIFSGLNNVEDISLSRTYADLCGISEADLHHYFTQSVQELAQANELTQEECFAQLKDYYDGYHFAPDTPDIYNPFSLLRCLKSREFGDYWYETGTPTFVIKALQRGQYDLADLSLTPVPASCLNGVNADDSDPVPVLYQSGYLTIKAYDKQTKEYTLGYPRGGTRLHARLGQYFRAFRAVQQPVRGQEIRGGLQKRRYRKPDETLRGLLCRCRL